MFKVGDVIKGIKNGDNTHVRYNLLQGRVIELFDNNKTILIEVLEHSDRSNIGLVFKDYNSDELFELLNKTGEKVKIEQITCLLDEFSDNELNRAKQTLERVIENKEEARRRFAKYIKDESELRYRIEELTASSGFKNESLNKLFNELRAIEDDAKCEKVVISDDKINIYTTQLYIEDEKFKNGHFKMNKYHIIINLRDLTTLVFGTLDEYKRESCWSDECPHPHVSDSGRPCWGNTEAMLVDSLENKEIYTAFMLVVNFLETFNIADTAGKKIVNWDFVSKKDDNKILTNPYSIYARILDCGCCIGRDDDVYQCDDCNITLCSDCYYQCDDCSNIFCRDHITNLKYEEKHICNSCKSDYVYVNDLNEYIDEIHSFACDACETIFSKDSSNSYTRNDNLEVIVCNSCFKNKHYICSDCNDFIADGNQVWIASENKYVCEDCKDNNYSFAEDLFDYIHNSKCFICSECGDSYSNNIKNQYIDTLDNILNYCNYCYKESLTISTNE